MIMGKKIYLKYYKCFSSSIFFYDILEQKEKVRRESEFAFKGNKVNLEELS